MFKSRLANVAVLFAVIFGSGLLIGLLFPRWIGAGATPKAYNSATVLKQIQTLSQLVTVKYVMEKIEVLADPPQNPLRAALPDDTHVTLIAHGIVKAGIDLSKLQTSDVRISGTKLSLRLPMAQITDSYLDDKLTQVVERNTGFLRTFNKDLEQTARQNAIDDIRRAARTSGILKDADERARAQLTFFGKQLGFDEVEFLKP